MIAAFLDVDNAIVDVITFENILIIAEWVNWRWVYRSQWEKSNWDCRVGKTTS